MRAFFLYYLSLGLGLSGMAATAAGGSATAVTMPRFHFDTQWLKMPEDLATGEIVAVSVDRADHLWVLHRPRTVKRDAAIQPAPPVMEFDTDGRYLRGFGGPDAGYEWPDVEHSLAISARGHIWIGGNNLGPKGQGDDMLLEFDNAGRFVRQIGRKAASTGNFDRSNFHAPADIFVDDRAREIYVADGYGNQRIVVLDARNGAFRRMWGAYGAAPPKTSPGNPPVAAATASSFNGLHGVEISRDGKVYVSDRGNRRIQVFTRDGKFLQQIAINQKLAAPLTASGITFSSDTGQKYLFVADFGNGMIVVVDRKRGTVIGTIGRAGTAVGEFRGPHLIDSDSKGVIYVAEVQGRRVQRLTPVVR